MEHSRNEMRYVHVSINLTQGEIKCRIALNMPEFSEAQLFVYWLSFNPRNNNDINLVSKNFASRTAAWCLVRTVRVFRVLTSSAGRDEFTGIVVSVCRPGNDTEFVVVMCMSYSNVPTVSAFSRK